MDSFSQRLPAGDLAVAVSGGVDSLCSLLLCLRTGRQVTALHALLHDRQVAEGQSEREALARVCERLGVELRVVDLRDRFRECVVRPFARAYLAALTPNPCAWCNRLIKFGALWEAARESGAACLITGHYAGLTHDHPYGGEGPLLCAAEDRQKDQTYFLGLVPREALRRTAFPLAHREKPDVRRLVAEAGLTVPAQTESQEICFVPKTHQGYRDFLAGICRDEGQRLPGPGDIVEETTGRVLGRHQGLWQYTEGQRRGIGVTWSRPLYVTGKRTADNALLVAGKERTRIRNAVAGSLNLFVEPEQIPRDCLVRLRYRQTPVPADVRIADGKLHIRCLEPLSLSAPGQIAVVTDPATRLLAAGIIEKLT